MRDVISQANGRSASQRSAERRSAWCIISSSGQFADATALMESRLLSAAGIVMRLAPFSERALAEVCRSTCEQQLAAPDSLGSVSLLVCQQYLTKSIESRHCLVVHSRAERVARSHAAGAVVSPGRSRSSIVRAQLARRGRTRSVCCAWAVKECYVRKRVTAVAGAAARIRPCKCLVGEEIKYGLICHCRN